MSLLQVKRLIAADGWRFSSPRIDMIAREVADWKKRYLPLALKGKTVLDVGAGEGETAWFFLREGADRVVCVEADSFAVANLRYNARRHAGVGVEVAGEAFRLEHLEVPHDFLKVDIEGYEEVLLQVKLDKPAVVEVHGLQLADKFASAGWRIVNPYKTSLGRSRFSCTVLAYWMC